VTAGIAGLAGTVALAGIVALAVGLRVLRRRLAVVAVFGPSMQPALRPGDRVLVRRAQLQGLRAGQIVVVERPQADGTWTTRPPRWPADDREWLIKRVAAVPGDARPQEIAAGPGGSLVPPGVLVVLGDNAARSLDSRQFGYIPAERLLGVMLRPLARP
jgi:signal peptidase I